MLTSVFPVIDSIPLSGQNPAVHVPGGKLPDIKILAMQVFWRKTCDLTVGFPMLETSKICQWESPDLNFPYSEEPCNHHRYR